MKKILAGVLAAASMLTMTVSASATSNDKAVTKAGEVTYEVAIAPEKVTLDLVMPAKMTAALNPYGAEITLGAGASGDVATTTGIASVAYTFTNKSTKYGVWVDANATTTTSDKAWSVSAVETGKKSAELYLVAANDVDELGGFADKLSTITTGKATDNSGTAKQGAMKLDSKKLADKDAGTVAGQTVQKKMMFVAAKDDTNGDGEAVLAFLGDVAKDDEIEWTEEDTINVNLILKVSAGAKTIDGASSTDGDNGSFTTSVAKDKITSGGGLNIGSLTADDTFAASLDASSAGLGVKLTFDGFSVNTVESSDTNVIKIGTAANKGKLDWGDSVTNGDVTLTYTLTPDGGGADVTLKIVVTVSNAS